MSKKKQRRASTDGGLNITSMMDMMTIILVFLLKSYSTDDISVAASDDLQVPISSSAKPPKLAVNVVVSRRDIVVDGDKVLELERGTSAAGLEQIVIPDDQKKGALIEALYTLLVEKAEVAKDIEAKSGNTDIGFKGEILLQCDRRLPFSVVRDVMYTAGQAQFGNFRFVVISSGG